MYKKTLIFCNILTNNGNSKSKDVYFDAEIFSTFLFQRKLRKNFNRVQMDCVRHTRKN